MIAFAVSRGNFFYHRTASEKNDISGKYTRTSPKRPYRQGVRVKTEKLL